MYQTDVLEILEILTRAGYRDPRMQEAVDAVRARQEADGCWKLASSFNGKFLVDIEAKGKPSRWITLRALQVLKRWEGASSIDRGPVDAALSTRPIANDAV
jgi:hypothetical protein